MLQRPPHVGMSCSCPIGACDGGSGQRGVPAGQAHVRPCWLQAAKGYTSHPGEPGPGPLTAHVAASGWALPPAWLTHAPRQGARAQWPASGSRTAGSPSDLGSGSPFLLFPCPLEALTEHGRHERVPARTRAPSATHGTLPVGVGFSCAFASQLGETLRSSGAWARGPGPGPWPCTHCPAGPGFSVAEALL